jgi:uncharacterized membrane protein
MSQDLNTTKLQKLQKSHILVIGVIISIMTYIILVNMCLIGNGCNPYNIELERTTIIEFLTADCVSNGGIVEIKQHFSTEWLFCSNDTKGIPLDDPALIHIMYNGLAK